MLTESEKRLAPIESLPVDIHQQMIFNHLSNEELYTLSQTSCQMLFYCKPHLQERATKKLLSHVVKGEEAEVLEMIRVNPKLLFHTSTATDYSGRTYNCTPFQAALLCHDVTMWKKMELYFTELQDGQTEKAKQFNALFPEGVSQGTPYDFTALIQTITNSSAADIDAALNKTQNDTAICNALNHFRSDFKALAMQETFFNPSHLIRALKVYDEQFDSWSWAKCKLFWRQVIGYTERFLPACLAQAFIQGFYYTIREQKPFLRSLKFKHDAGSYYPLLDSSGLGFDFGICWSPHPSHKAPGLAIHEYDHQPLIKYVEQIQKNYIDLSTECSVPESPLRTTIR